MTLEDAEKLSLSCLKQVMEDKITKVNVEVVLIPTATLKIVRRTPEEVNTILKGLA